MHSFAIIQDGAGVAASDWRLARAVSRRGQLGVVAGAMLPVMLSRRLQLGDFSGHLRRALAAFPDAALAARVRDEHLVAGGKASAVPFRAVSLPSATPDRDWTELAVLAGFVEVFLAKAGQPGAVALGLREKSSHALRPVLFGAMLAGVDVVIADSSSAERVAGEITRLAAGGDSDLLHAAAVPPALRHPALLAYVPDATTAAALARQTLGRVRGFLWEASAINQEVEAARFMTLDQPFWVAGTAATKERLAEVRALGAAGLVVGSAFTFCEESGLEDSLKSRVCVLARVGGLRPRPFASTASPWSQPSLTVDLKGSLSRPEVFAQRTRVCDVGHFRESYRRDDGSTGYRCPGEPVHDHVRKGGSLAATEGRVCLCNATLSAAGLAQCREGGASEPALVTVGGDAAGVSRFLLPGEKSYSAARVIEVLLGRPLQSYGFASVEEPVGAISPKHVPAPAFADISARSASVR